MPELPEVETVRAGLVPTMEGQVIRRVDVNRPDLRWPFPERMAERLRDVTVLRLRRRSKYILADLSSGETLLIHLGMSGRILISGDPLGQFHRDHPAPEKHDHVVFHMASGARVTFNDPRRFGAMDLFATETGEGHKLLRDLGPEPRSEAGGGAGQYLCLRGALPRRDIALASQRPDFARQDRGAGSAYPDRFAGGDPIGWLVASRLPDDRRRAWVFPASFRRLRPRRAGLRDAGLWSRDPARGAVGAVEFLLPAVPKIA